MNASYILVVHMNLPPSPVILWTELGGKPKWLPLDFGYHDEMRTGPNGGSITMITALFILISAAFICTCPKNQGIKHLQGVQSPTHKQFLKGQCHDIQ